MHSNNRGHEDYDSVQDARRNLKYAEKMLYRQMEMLNPKKNHREFIRKIIGDMVNASIRFMERLEQTNKNER